MKEFLDVICSKWNDFTDSEKDAISKVLTIKSTIAVKDEDIILIKIPIDEQTGGYLLDYDTLNTACLTIKNMFKNNKVLITPLDIEIISEEKEIDNA